MHPPRQYLCHIDDIGNINWSSSQQPKEGQEGEEINVKVYG